MANSEKTILIIDDEELLREILFEVFIDHGFRTLLASSKEEALSIIEAEPVDLILSDLRMPRFNGIEFLKLIRSAYNYQGKFVLVTGFQEFSIEDLYNLGVDSYFMKPFNCGDMARAIQELVLGATQ